MCENDGYDSWFLYGKDVMSPWAAEKEKKKHSHSFSTETDDNGHHDVVVVVVVVTPSLSGPSFSQPLNTSHLEY